MKSKKGLVLVKWLDSHSGKGWKGIEELEAVSKPLVCKSVGWLVLRNNQWIIVAPHVAGDESEGIIVQYCGNLTIPRKAIIKISSLKEG